MKLVKLVTPVAIAILLLAISCVGPAETPGIPTHAPTPTPAPAPTPTPPPAKTAKEWYEGGTLHKATVGEWHRATYANRLATCADWVVAANRAEAERDFSTVKPKAIELEKCITEATKDISEIQHHQVTEYAATCLILLGYTK